MIIYDANGLPIGTDGNPETDSVNAWDTNAPDPLIGQLTLDNLPQNKVSFFQQQITQFQNILWSVDSAAITLQSLAANPDLSADDAASVNALLDEYAGRKAAFKFAAEAFNAIASTINAAGGSVTALEIPAGLGFAPLAIPVGYAVAIAAATILVSFGVGWLSRATTLSADVSSRYIALANATTDPTEKQRLLNMGAVAQAAADQVAQKSADAGSTTLGQLSNIAKWVAIGAGLFLIYKMIYDKGGKHGDY